MGGVGGVVVVGVAIVGAVCDFEGVATFDCSTVVVIGSAGVISGVVRSIVVDIGGGVVVVVKFTSNEIVVVV